MIETKKNSFSILTINGVSTGADRVIVETIYSKIIKGNKTLKTYAKINDADVFEQSIFPDIFKKITQECYSESQTQSFF